MGAKNLLFLNGLDMFTEYGLVPSPGSLNELLRGKKAKEVYSNDWAEYDGKEYDLSETPKQEDRIITIKAYIIVKSATAEAEFWQKYKALKAAFKQPGTQTLFCKELEGEYGLSGGRNLFAKSLYPFVQGYYSSDGFGVIDNGYWVCTGPNVIPVTPNTGYSVFGTAKAPYYANPSSCPQLYLFTDGVFLTTIPVNPDSPLFFNSGGANQVGLGVGSGIGITPGHIQNDTVRLKIEKGGFTGINSAPEDVPSPGIKVFYLDMPNLDRKTRLKGTDLIACEIEIQLQEVQNVF